MAAFTSEQLYKMNGPDLHNDVVIYGNARAEEQPPARHTGEPAGNRAVWNDIWSVVLFILEQTRADYRYKDPNGRDLGQIIREIRTASPDGEKDWHPDFRQVVRWLADHGVNTDPAAGPAH